MSVIDDGFTDASVYLVVFKSKKNDLKFARTIVTPFFLTDEEERINYINKLLKKTFQDSIKICSIEWMVDTWIPKQ